MNMVEHMNEIDPNNIDSSKKEQRQIQIAPLKVELTGLPKNSVWFFVLLLLCGASFGIAWAVNTQHHRRIILPESKLSVLELETTAIKFAGVDGGFLKDHSQVGISFEGFARLGVDLSKAKFDLDRKSEMMTIELPTPEVTEVSVTGTHTWDRSPNKSNEKELDALECKLCNDALSECRGLACDQYYIDTSKQLARIVLRAYFKRNYPNLEIQFK